ncbi:MAG: hypothetical protein RMA76_35755 [Deltaproteobacteria bacterium]|jgi:hypothetical protein
MTKRITHAPTRSTGVAIASLAIAAVGCKSDEPSAPATGVLAQAAQAAQVFQAIAPCDPVTIDQSMVIHDQATLSLVDFSFLRTIAAIRVSSGGATTTDADLAETITSGLLNTTFPQPVSGLPIPATPRPPEAALTGAQLIAQMQPIALFNRFDLAPANGDHCGEYRIVYGRYPNAVTNRYLLIFEAALPNPTPSLGIEGCRDVAEFWHGLSDTAMTTAQRAAALEDFYYNGLPGFSPVVDHAHYGVPFGQVRSNMFVNAASQNFTWQLREWRSSFNTGGQPVFTPDTVKDNPLVEFHDENSSNPNPTLFSSEQTAFVSHYTGGAMPNLLAFELNGGTSPIVACPEVNTVSAGFDNRFNEFQSHSNGPAPDDPVAAASTAFHGSITTVLSGNTAFAGLNSTHVLARSTAMSCAGCHELSVGDAISPSATWPAVAAGGFVHVRELGSTPPAVTPLSPALNNCFLPARAQNLESFVCNAPPPDAGVSDSGTQPDSGTPDSGTPSSCGGPYDPPCSPYEYCEFGPYNICGAQGSGTCQPRPTGCGYGGPQVCGCDGNTYPNACTAQASGTDVASTGACGCNLTAPNGCCYDDEVCAKTIRGGECIGAACSKAQPGVCKAPPPAGYCWENEDCGSGQICSGASICPCGAQCIKADAPGVCKTLSDTSKSEVTTAKAGLLSATNSTEAERAKADFDEAVEAAREAERAQPGAFVPQRRTH